MSSKRTLSTTDGPAEDEDPQNSAGQGLAEGVFEKRAITPEPGKKRKKVDPVRSILYKIILSLNQIISVLLLLIYYSNIKCKTCLTS